MKGLDGFNMEDQSKFFKERIFESDLKDEQVLFGILGREVRYWREEQRFKNEYISWKEKSYQFIIVREERKVS